MLFAPALFAILTEQSKVRFIPTGVGGARQRIMEGNDRTARASASTGDDEGGYHLPDIRSLKETMMTRAELAEKILDIKREKGWTWKSICEAIGGYSPVLIVGVLLGQMKLALTTSPLLPVQLCAGQKLAQAPLVDARPFTAASAAGFTAV